MSVGFWRIFWPVLLCAVLWGSAFPAIKSVYLHWGEAGVVVTVWDRWLFAGVRFVVAGVGLLCLARRPFVEWRATPKGWFWLFVGTQAFFQYVFFYLALVYASGSLASVLGAAGSFWWMILAPVLLGVAWPSGRQWLAVCVGAVGVVLAVYAPGTGAGDPVLGAVFLLSASFIGALGVVVFGKLKPTMGSRAATGFALFLGGLGLVFLGAGSWGRLGILFDGYVIGVTCWLAFVSAMAFGVWNHLSTLYPVGLLASFRFLIPVCGVVLSLVFLEGESAGWGLVVGGALVVGSVVMSNRLKG